MVQDPALVETLLQVAKAMRSASDDWWIIAGAAAALHGVDDPAASDVDVLASDRDALSILKALALSPLERTPHPRFRSRILGRWSGPPLPVEIMAGFEHRSEAGWRSVSPTTRQAVTLNGATLFVPARTELADLMTAFGRPKDLVRANRLRSRLQG